MSDQRFEQIERYLRGKMPAAEAFAFEAEMASDPALAALVQQHRLERQGLELLVERELLARMKNWDRETELFQRAQPRRATVRPMMWFMRAAAVLVVLVAGYWFFQEYNATAPDATPPIAQTKPEIKPRVPTVRRPKPTPPRRDTQSPTSDPQPGIAAGDDSPQTPAPIEEMPAVQEPDYAALAGEFYRENDFLPPKGSKGGQTGTADYDRALEKFQDGKYNDAVSKLKPQMKFGTEAIQYKELLALSLYKNQQYEAAFPYFREVAASGKQPYAQRAEWGMVLTLLNQMPEKKQVFERVLSTILNNPQHVFYSKAQDLKERLR